MDAQRFDALTRTLSTVGTRRTLSGILAIILGLLHLVPTASPEAAARKKKRRQRRQRKDKNEARTEGPCGNGGGKANRCKRNRQCCTGYCKKRKRKRKKNGKRRKVQGRCRCRGEGQRCTDDRTCCPERTGRICKQGTCQIQLCAEPCPDGCCDDGTCRPGDSDAACGANGAPCQTCTTEQQCAAGVCELLPCAERCAGCCDGEACHDPPTDAFCGTNGAACQSCSTTQTCRAGTCALRPCAQRCPGCCAGETCEDGDTVEACGTDGETCQVCGTHEVCTAGQCVCGGDVCAEGCPYLTIQDAIDDGILTTIRLCAGTYTDVNISRNLILLGVGDGLDGTILDGLRDDGTRSTVILTDVDTTATVEGVRITGGQGNVNADGGGVFNRGDLTLRDCTVTGNDANGDGAGIANIGKLTLDGCTVTGNEALGTAQGKAGNGGGILNFNLFSSACDVTLTGCTIADNTANSGGGIYNETGCTVNITSTTFSANSPDNCAGGGTYPGDTCPS